MKFRHHQGARLTLPSGHVTLIGKEWRDDVPKMFWQEALAKGCQCDKTVIDEREPHVSKASSAAVKPLDEDSSIRAALVIMIARDAELDFTTAGMPNLNTLSDECGFKVDRESAYRVFEAMKNEAAEAEEAEAEALRSKAKA